MARRRAKEEAFLRPDCLSGAGCWLSGEREGDERAAAGLRGAGPREPRLLRLHLRLTRIIASHDASPDVVLKAVTHHAYWLACIEAAPPRHEGRRRRRKSASLSS